MAKSAAYQIVSANDLLGGQVVYFNRDGQWTETLGDATVAHGKEAAADLLAHAEQSPHQAVGPYLVGVEVNADGRPAPSHMREVMRETGPTVARQHLAV